MARASYEVINPSFSDMNIEKQIAAGINDWCAEDSSGREFFGRTRDEAEIARCLGNRTFERVRVISTSKD